MSVGTGSAVLLVVPSGQWHLDAIVAAVRSAAPGAALCAVWCGDPHRRPMLPESVAWADLGLDEPGGRAWGLLQCALDGRAHEWLRTSAAVRRLLQEDDRTVVVVRVGSVAVNGGFGDLLGPAPITVVGRDDAPEADDGCSPTEAELMRAGGLSPNVASFRRGAEPALEWLERELVLQGAGAGPLIERMARRFDATVSADPRIGVGGWRAPAGSDEPTVLDLDGLDPSAPFAFAVGDRPSRVRLSAHPALARTIAAVVPQVEGHPAELRLPGGLPVDRAVRRCVRNALAGPAASLPADPFGAQLRRFLKWLEAPGPGAANIGRYWVALHEERPDLRAAFPDVSGCDGAAFRAWIADSWRRDGEGGVLVHDPAQSTFTTTGRDQSGINVLGYLAFEQSLGHVAREMIAALKSARVKVARLNYERAVQSRRADGSWDDEARYATNVCVVAPDQFELLIGDHGDGLLAGRRNIAYWFWELEHVPDRFVRTARMVDEIWAGSRFIADAFRSVTDTPVHHVPLPIAEPRPSTLTRRAMGVPDDSFVFLTTFDQLSVPERKNPFGTIDAFTRAFREGEGPTLLIKTMNGDRAWKHHERLLLAAAGRSDIVVWDQHLNRADQMAVVANADCLVSLHRSEGLGMHCAEAMWLRKPVIATRYSGNLDFMDDSVAAMIDFSYVPVAHGEGIYPAEARWADPDIDQAAEWMRRLAGNRADGRDLGERARARMLAQPSLADAGRRMAELAGITVSAHVDEGRT